MLPTRWSTPAMVISLALQTAMAMAGLTGRMDLCVAGLFGAGKSRAAAVMLVGMLIALQSCL